MAQIGIFTKGTDGNFTGTLQTLTINAKLTMVVAERGGTNSPSHRIFAGKREIGAAWEKTSKENRTYYSLKIEDPSLSSPLFASLVETDKADEYSLIWNRPGTSKSK
jgi:uncharacterized protein (DUF736 family)